MPGFAHSQMWVYETLPDATGKSGLESAVDILGQKIFIFCHFQRFPDSVANTAWKLSQYRTAVEKTSK